MTTVKYKIHHPKTQDWGWFCEKGLLIGSENTNAGHRHHHQYVITKPLGQTPFDNTLFGSNQH